MFKTAMTIPNKANKVKSAEQVAAQTIGLQEGVEYNLRGLNTYNLIKRVIWSSVTDRPKGVTNEKSDINLPLLKGLL